MKKRPAASTGYEKISATLEGPVLRQIRERTTNVSGFLNEAAKRKLYFDRLREFSAELGRRGVERDERLYESLMKLGTEKIARQRKGRRRSA